MPNHSFREVRAVYDERTITVYQAFSAAIAQPAIAANGFVEPFSLNRMTWIKPSFLWMMYRSGWGRKPGQEHVLAVKMLRAGFERALENSCLSHFEAETYVDYETWEARRNSTDVRVQWDPERSSTLAPLQYRSLQVGLSGWAIRSYVEEWIVSIADISARVRKVESDVANRAGLLPKERVYPLPPKVGSVVGASSAG